jgi:hypothetical protein
MRRTAIFCLAGLAAACSPRYDELHFDEVRSGNPQSVHADMGLIAIPVGIAAALRVDPEARGYREYEDFHLVELESEDPDILDVRPGPELDTFVFMGSSVGRTRVTVTIRGDEVDHIDAEVRDQ